MVKEATREAEVITGTPAVPAQAGFMARISLDLYSWLSKRGVGSVDHDLPIGMDALGVVVGGAGLRAGKAAVAARAATADARVATQVAAGATGRATRAVAYRELAVRATTGGPVRRVVAAVGGRVLGTGNLGTVATSSLARSEQALTAAA